MGFVLDSGFDWQREAGCYIISILPLRRSNQRLNPVTAPSKIDANASTPRLDRLGICVSAVCLIQCLSLSLALLLAPFAYLGIFGSDWFHMTLLIVIVPIGLAAFWQGYRRHGRLGLVLVGMAGLVLLLTTAVLEVIVLPALAASALTALGGALLIVAHWLNLRSSRGVCRRRESSADEAIGIAADY